MSYSVTAEPTPVAEAVREAVVLECRRHGFEAAAVFYQFAVNLDGRRRLYFAVTGPDFRRMVGTDGAAVWVNGDDRRYDLRDPECFRRLVNRTYYIYLVFNDLWPVARGYDYPESD